MSAALRPIKPVKVPGERQAAPPPAIKFEWVAPCDLYVEDAYQREVGDRSRTLITRIVRGWDWLAMKPPICARADGKLVVIDGQHTAIAAASHGSISKIPVMIVEAKDISRRALSFILHNTMRTNVTRCQTHFAGVTAGEEIAVAVASACKKAGVTIRRAAPANGEWGENETVSISSMRRIVQKKGEAGLLRVLRILVPTEREPISAVEMKALFDVRYVLKAPVTDKRLTEVIAEQASDFWSETARRLSKEKRIPNFRALAQHWADAAAKPAGQIDRQALLIAAQRRANAAKRRASSIRHAPDGAGVR